MIGAVIVVQNDIGNEQKGTLLARNLKIYTHILSINSHPNNSH